MNRASTVSFEFPREVKADFWKSERFVSVAAGFSLRRLKPAATETTETKRSDFQKSALVTTTTETPLAELSADLLERVGNLSPAAKKSLGGLLEQDAAEEAQYTRELWSEIRRRLDAYDRGGLVAHDWPEPDFAARIRAQMETMQKAQIQCTYR